MSCFSYLYCIFLLPFGLKIASGDIPGGSLVKTPCLQCRRHRFDPGQVPELRTRSLDSTAAEVSLPSPHGKEERSTEARSPSPSGALHDMLLWGTPPSTPGSPAWWGTPSIHSQARMARGGGLNFIQTGSVPTPPRLWQACFSLKRLWAPCLDEVL